MSVANNKDLKEARKALDLMNKAAIILEKIIHKQKQQSIPLGIDAYRLLDKGYTALFQDCLVYDKHSKGAK